MKKRGLAAGTCALVIVALFLLWPDSSPAPAPGGDTERAPETPAAFSHANWDTTATTGGDRAAETEAENEDEAPRLPARLRGVEVALPVPAEARK